MNTISKQYFAESESGKRHGYFFLRFFIVTLITFSASFGYLFAQRVATLQLTTTGNEKFSIPVQANLDAIALIIAGN